MYLLCFREYSLFIGSMNQINYPHIFLTIGMVENLRKKALIVYEGIFNKQEIIEIDRYKYYMKYNSRKGLRLYKIEGYSYLEQNPDTGSNWAKWLVKDIRSCGL